ncbi:hypothetical protein BB934_07535 [Microvirga ossetica]|uniref:Uncharacterized protein n=1 Tax=Microvirga ossetica TaxID=1882682 RepID=A0A1B2EDN9_9HYPH|nr:hypothetical protein [Microvirga ossetica]ANY78104.1 hypothetical protein BB934_07535 [Microvirga ossetica]
MAKGKVPKSITIKIPKALRKSRLVKSLLAYKVDYGLLVSVFVAAGSAAALALTRESAGERQASEPAQEGWFGRDIVVRVGTNGSGPHNGAGKGDPKDSDAFYSDDGE